MTFEERQEKIIEIIAFYKVVEKFTEGPMKVCTQQNEMLGEYNNTKYYIDHLLKDLDNYIISSREEKNWKYFISIGDINENIESIKIRNFISKNRLVNTHAKINSITWGQLYNTYKHIKNYIDVVLCICNLNEYIKGY